MERQAILALLHTNSLAFDKKLTPDEAAIIGELWCASFAEYPAETVKAAFTLAAKNSRFFLKPADILAFMPQASENPESEWQALKAVLPAVRGWVYRRISPLAVGIDSDGKPIWSDGTKELEILFNGLSGASREYLGGVSGLVDLSRRQGDELDVFERGRFTAFVSSPARKNQVLIEASKDARLLPGGSQVAALEKGGTHDAD